MASDYIREFMDATKHLKDAADQLKKSSGGKPIGQSLADSVKNMLVPAAGKDYAGRRTIAEQFGFDPKGYRDETKPGPPPQPADTFKQAQHDMIRHLVSRMGDKKFSGKSDPRIKPKPTKPSKLSVITRHAARSLGRTLAPTKLGRFAGKVAATPAGKAVGGLAMRAAGGVAARAGVSAGAGAATGAGAGALGVSALTGIGLILAAIVVVAAALYAFGKVITEAADEQLKAMRQYEKVSASMAQVFAQADMKDVFRNMERGQRLAPSAQALSNADQKLKDNSSEIVILVDRIQNNILAFLEGELADVVGLVNSAAKAANEWFGNKEDANKPQAFDQFLDQIRRDAIKAQQAGDRWHAAARR